MTALLDSGSNSNVMSSCFFEKNIAPLHVLHSAGRQAVSFNGSSSSILGTYETELTFDKTTVPVNFEVVKDIKYDAMFGRDFLDKNIEYLNTKNGAIYSLLFLICSVSILSLVALAFVGGGKV